MFDIKNIGFIEASRTKMDANCESLLSAWATWIIAPLLFCTTFVARAWCIWTRVFPPVRWATTLIGFVIRCILCVQIGALCVYICHRLVATCCIMICAADRFIDSYNGSNTIVDVLGRVYGTPRLF